MPATLAGGLPRGGPTSCPAGRITVAANRAYHEDLARRRDRGRAARRRGGARPDLRDPVPAATSSRSRSGSRTIIAATCTRTDLRVPGGRTGNRLGGISSAGGRRHGGNHGQDGTPIRGSPTRWDRQENGRGARGGRGRGKVQRDHGNRDDRRHAPAQVCSTRGTEWFAAGGALSSLVRSRRLHGPGVGIEGPSGGTSRESGAVPGRIRRDNGRIRDAARPPAAERAAPRGRDSWRRAFASAPAEPAVDRYPRPTAAAGGPDHWPTTASPGHRPFGGADSWSWRDGTTK